MWVGMSKKKLGFLLRLALLTLLVSGCQYEQSEVVPSIPGIDMSSDHVNQDITLFLQPSRNTYKIDDDVVIDVHLQSNIQVDSDFDVKIYALDKKNNKWIEATDFVGTSSILLPLKNETVFLEKNNSNSVIIIHPVLKEKNAETKLAVTVKGPILENNEKTNNNAESYIILNLYPQ